MTTQELRALGLDDALFADFNEMKDVDETIEELGVRRDATDIYTNRGMWSVDNDSGKCFSFTSESGRTIYFER